jgi:O-antigen/teichoic acid export membrane protein
MLLFGGWLSVSNVIGPVIVYADRFLIATLISAAALTYYSAPFEVVSRLLLLPTALTAALFPALSGAQVDNAALSKGLRTRATALIGIVVLPVVVIGMVLAETFLSFWRGFCRQSTRVMQILLLGFLFNALAQVPFSTLHSHGIAKQPAVLHLVELPLYVIMLIACIQFGGVEGAAVAWSIRAFFDLGMMSLLLRFHERKLRSSSLQADLSSL